MFPAWRSEARRQQREKTLKDVPSFHFLPCQGWTAHISLVMTHKDSLTLVFPHRRFPSFYSLFLPPSSSLPLTHAHAASLSLTCFSTDLWLHTQSLWCHSDIKWILIWISHVVLKACQEIKGILYYNMKQFYNQQPFVMSQNAPTPHFSGSIYFSKS